MHRSQHRKFLAKIERAGRRPPRSTSKVAHQPFDDQRTLPVFVASTGSRSRTPAIRLQWPGHISGRRICSGRSRSRRSRSRRPRGPAGPCGRRRYSPGSCGAACPTTAAGASASPGLAKWSMPILHVAEANQLFGNDLGLIDTLILRRKPCLVNPPLVGLQPRQMGIAEAGDPVRRQRHDQRAGLADRIRRSAAAARTSGRSSDFRMPAERRRFDGGLDHRAAAEAGRSRPAPAD